MKTPLLISILLMSCVSRAFAVDDVEIALRTFIADCDPESRGVSCVVVNHSKRPIKVWNHYDGVRNHVVCEEGQFPIGLRPPRKPPEERITIEPGVSHTLFSLSLDAIFFLDVMGTKSGWHWGWSERSPRGAPPASPVHPFKGLGWETRRTERCTIAAQVEIDGQQHESPPLELRLEPVGGETVKVLARLKTALLIPPAKARYELHFEQRSPIAGSLSKDERTFTLDWDDAEHLLAEVGGSWDKSDRLFHCKDKTLHLTFVRIPPVGRRPAGLALTEYHRVGAKPPDRK